LTRDFRLTVQARVQSDEAFRRGLLSDAIEALLAGERDLGREILRDFINATQGFPALAEKTGIHVKTLHISSAPEAIPPPQISSRSSPACSSTKECGCRWWRKSRTLLTLWPKVVTLLRRHHGRFSVN
jgi:hypothetical protein